MSLTTVDFLLRPLPRLFGIAAVALVVTFFAIRRRRSQPVASRLVIMGILAILVSAIGSYVNRIYSYRSFDRWQDASVHGQHIAEIYAVLHSVDVVGVILIAAAVFANRDQVQKLAQ